MQQISQQVILSTAYFPPIQYVSKLFLHTNVVVDIHETFLKQSYRNRCTILSANGKLDLIIPVIKPNGNKTQTKDIQIDHKDNWKHVHWQAIVSAYKQSPFFEFFEEELISLFSQTHNYLIDWNMECMKVLFSCLDEQFTLSFSEKYLEEGQYDFRDSISPKPRLQKEDVNFRPEPYYQTFIDKFEFQENLSILDLIFNEGPQALFICRKSNTHA